MMHKGLYLPGYGMTHANFAGFWAVEGYFEFSHAKWNA